MFVCRRLVCIKVLSATLGDVNASAAEFSRSKKATF